MENIEYFAKVQFFADKPAEGPGFFLSHPNEPGFSRQGSAASSVYIPWSFLTAANPPRPPPLNLSYFFLS